MKFLILFLFPVLSSAQIVDNIYNKLFSFRPFERVTYSEIKKFKIKCIKYTSTRMNPFPRVDSLGNRIRGLNRIREVHYERFDSLGMMNGLNKKNCPDDNSTQKKVRYSEETLNLLMNLKETLEGKSEFAFHDSIAKFIFLFDKTSNSIKLKNYNNWHANVSYKEFLNDKLEFKYPEFDVKHWTFFLNEVFELKRDSFFLEGVLGCETITIASNYKYNSNGQVVQRIDLSNDFDERWVYNTEGNLSKILRNGKLYAKYYYKNKKLHKIVFEDEIGLRIIEFEY